MRDRSQPWQMRITSPRPFEGTSRPQDIRRAREAMASRRVRNPESVIVIRNKQTGKVIWRWDGGDAEPETACTSECPDYPGLICVVEGDHTSHYAMGQHWPNRIMNEA